MVFDKNKRSKQRSVCYIISEYTANDIKHPVIIKNLNKNGAFIESRSALTIGDDIMLTFPIHYLDPPIKVNAKVAWSNKDGFGVIFDKIKQEKKSAPKKLFDFI